MHPDTLSALVSGLGSDLPHGLYQEVINLSSNHLTSHHVNISESLSLLRGACLQKNHAMTSCTISSPKNEAIYNNVLTADIGFVRRRRMRAVTRMRFPMQPRDKKATPASGCHRNYSSTANRLSRS